MKRLLATLSTGLLLAGCATMTHEQIAVSTNPQPTPAPQMEVKVEKPAKPIKKPFSERIFVGAIRDVDTNDGYRKAQVSVKNHTGQSIRMIYRFRW
ncbi:MAG: hypothetical protein IJS15_09840, partial [Victivallales bacterium]|nr:hypothetical protein [Victivallales bacterium]